MVEIGRSIAAKDIPPAVNAEYKAIPLWFVLLICLSQTGTFWGCFFGAAQKGDDGSWSPAWWAFCFVGQWFWVSKVKVSWHCYGRSTEASSTLQPFFLYPQKYVREGTKLKVTSCTSVQPAVTSCREYCCVPSLRS